MSYQPIENYGVIGDLNTVALAGKNGSIDFMCFPDFDSPTVFAQMLDFDKGGVFCIQPATAKHKTRQMYLPDTNVLLTRFLSEEGIVEVMDFMPTGEASEHNHLVRRVSGVRGEIVFRMKCAPRFNYGQDQHYLSLKDNVGVFKSDKISLRMRSSVKMQKSGHDLEAEFVVRGGESVDFVLGDMGQDDFEQPVQDFVNSRLRMTIEFWKNWISQSNYRGRWVEIVNRSALVLKLLTSRKYGSMVAAPTFGLPEWIGGPRNWDYRYTWIRDSSFTAYALLKLGYNQEAGDFMSWIEKRCQNIGDVGYLGLMYRLNGENGIVESTLDHFEGYERSSPVRIGNAAHDQLQLDIYGELLDAVYLYNKYGEPISYDLWQSLMKQVDWLCDNWNQPDEGIWEVRGGRQYFLYSRMMCWVAVDRAVKIGDSRPFPYPDRWRKIRDDIYNSVFEDFWNEEKKCFVQCKGSDVVDGATLLMPLIRFVGPKDPRWLSTLNVIEEHLVSDFLVYRYRPDMAAPDGLKGEEGTFSMCTFWYVECLAKAGQVEKARLYFEKMLGYANHLGLYSEMLGFQGEHLGNTPQAFTHMALISAALSLDRQLDSQGHREVLQPEML